MTARPGLVVYIPDVLSKTISGGKLVVIISSLLHEDNMMTRDSNVNIFFIMKTVKLFDEICVVL